MFLEESVKRSGLGIMSLAANKTLHISEVFNKTSEEERKKAEKRKIKKTLKNGRTVTVLWSSESDTPQTNNKEEREEKNEQGRG